MIQRPTTTLTGSLEATLYKLVSRRAEVRKVESVGGDFRLVTLGGVELEDRKWIPGNMIQIAFAGWDARAYTPSEYDPQQGTLHFLGYVHGNGIGSAWLAAPILGEALFLAGPRQGIDLNALQRPALFFGDETSVSTAAALQATQFGVQNVTFLLEVNSLERTQDALDRMGLTESVTLVLRQAEDGHLEEVEHRALELFKTTPSLQAALTGKASSIQRLYKSLKRAGVPTKQVTNLAYWAPGKKGLS